MHYLMGLDGGGTGTKICVADEEGNISCRFVADALNFNGQNEEYIQNTIRRITRKLESKGYQANDCMGIGVGAAGISNPKEKELLKYFFQKEGFKRLCLYGDHETAFASAFPECRGIVLISGTGSLCYGVGENGQAVRCGGFGHIMDDGGSAYMIAVEILSAIVRAEDGRGEKTVLKELVFNMLQLSSVGELLQYVYAPERSKGEIAALAVLLSQAGEMEDQAATHIKKLCIVKLQELVETVGRKLPKERRLALHGSVLEKNEGIRNGLVESLKQKDVHWDIFVNKGRAEDGALYLLRMNKD